MNEFVEFISLSKTSVLYVESQPRSMKQPDTVSAEFISTLIRRRVVGRRVSSVALLPPPGCSFLFVVVFFYPVKAFVCES